jgi:hypothetical protein
MKPVSKLKLAKRNAVAIAKYADLVGLTPENFLNRFLQDFLGKSWALTGKHRPRNMKKNNRIKRNQGFTM